MGNEKACSNFQVCHFGLPGFPSLVSSNEASGVNSYLYTMSPIDEGYIGTFVRKQRILFLASTLELAGGPSTIPFTFTNLDELIGATDLRVGLINPVGTAIIDNTILSGSTLSFEANFNISLGSNTYYLIFSVSYTPAP